MAVVGLLVTTLLKGFQTIVAHQPGDTVPSDSKPLFLEFDMHAGRTIGLAGRHTEEIPTGFFKRENDRFVFAKGIDGGSELNPLVNAIRI